MKRLLTILLISTVQISFGQSYDVKTIAYDPTGANDTLFSKSNTDSLFRFRNGSYVFARKILSKNYIPFWQIQSNLDNVSDLNKPLSTATISALSGKQYTIQVQALTSSPTDAQTIYFGNLPKAPTTTANTSKVYVRTASVIKAAEIYTYAGTGGTNESWSMYIRVNNTTDYLIATVSAATNERVFSKTDFNISLNANDYFEIKMVNPTFVTNPLTFIASGYIKLL